MGVERGGGIRPDGITVFPFAGGRSLIWDATCYDTWSQTGITSSAVQPGSSSKKAEKGKATKYSDLNDRLRFQFAAVETSGVFGPSSMKFLVYVCSKKTEIASDRRETEHLFQCIQLAVMRGNAYSVMAASRWLK